MNINFRELSLDDYEQYVKLINQLRPISAYISKEKYIDLFNTIFKSNKIFVAELENNLIGAITLVIEQKFIHNCSIYTRIEDVIVDNNFRGNNIGKQSTQTIRQTNIMLKRLIFSYHQAFLSTCSPTCSLGCLRRPPGRPWWSIV